MWLAVGVLLLGFLMRLGKSVSELVLFVSVAPSTALLLMLCVQQQEMIGVLWSFPTVVGTCFLFSTRVALLTCILITSLVAYAVHGFSDLPFVIRVFAVLNLVTFMALVFAKMLERQQQQLVGYASIDALTGAQNRFLLTRTLNALRKQSTSSKRPFSLLALDLIDFRHVNAQHGRSIGDLVLKGVVEFLRENLRPGDQVFRLDGKEFLICLPDTARSEAQCIALELQVAIAKLNLYEGAPLTAVFGVYESVGGASAEELLQSCERSLELSRAEKVFEEHHD